MGIIGASNARTVWKYVEEGKLPKPHYPSLHRPVWRLGEVLPEHIEHLESYDAAPRAFRGSDKLERTAAPEPVKETHKGSSAAARIRERLGLKRRG